MQPERPAVLHQQAHDGFEFAFHRVRQIGARFQEVFEVGGGEHQHFARAVHLQEIVAVAGFRDLDPLREVFDFLLRVLREEVVRDPHRQLVALREFHDDGVVVGIRLIAAARIDRARHAETVQLAHELARRVHLIVERQLRTFRERRVQQARIRARDQHARRIAAPVALDFAARRIRRVAVVADGAQRRCVQQRAVVEMQDEDGRIRCNRVDLFERRAALLRKLKFVPSADHAHPLRRRRARNLRAQHLERIAQRRHTIPAQLEIEIEAAANHVKVRIVETGNDRAALQVDAARRIVRPLHHVVIITARDDLAFRDGERRHERTLVVLRRYLAVVDHQVRNAGGLNGCGHRRSP